MDKTAEIKKKKIKGIVLLLSFVAIFVVFLLPIFNGMNGMVYLDNLYNTISKGSCYFIPEVKEKANELVGKKIEVKLKMLDSKQAEDTAKILAATGSDVTVQENIINLKGDLGAILMAVVEDSDYMYKNDGDFVRNKYGYAEKEVMYNWYIALEEIKNDLNRQKMFDEAKQVVTVKKKAVEVAYNYYGIESKSIKDVWFLVTFSLVFYVIYTIWYGFGLLYTFEGLGFKLEH